MMLPTFFLPSSDLDLVALYRLMIHEALRREEVRILPDHATFLCQISHLDRPSFCTEFPIQIGRLIGLS